MQIPPPIQRALVEGLLGVFRDQGYADKVLDHLFKKNKKFGSRDRRTLAELYYDLIRHWRLLAHYFACDEVEVEAIVKKFLEQEKSIMQIKNDSASLSWPVRESYPDRFKEFLRQERPQDYEQIFSAMNQAASVYLRVNSLKVNGDQVIAALKAEGINAEKIESVNSGLKLSERKNVFQTKAFKNGWFEVQDAGSQMIAPLLSPEPGARVIDACAGAGGKSLHLASLMRNKGKIIALDIHNWKLNELMTRARRAGIDIIEARHIDSSKVIKRLEGSADFLLLDVPCSGTGVIRRQPDMKWKWSIEGFQKTLEEQKNILTSYESMLKPGGHLLYATCSVLPSENQLQTKAFLEQNQNRYTLVKEVEILPHIMPYDGFYAALFKKLS